MATYPSGLFSWTTVVDNVDDVLAAHPNSLAAEIIALETKIGVDSSSVNTTIDYFLKNASGAFRTHVHDGTSDDGAKFTINNHSDVNITSVQDDNILQYNSSSGKWENVPLTSTLDGLSDVTISSAATRESIYFDGTDWHNGYPNAVYAS